MEEKFVIVKKVSLNNNCPECFSTKGLVLSFKQKLKDTIFIKSISNKVIMELNCKNCNTVIYPARWTDDIDRVVEYQNKAYKLKPSNLKLKPFSWVLIVVLVIILILTLFGFGFLDQLFNL